MDLSLQCLVSGLACLLMAASAAAGEKVYSVADYGAQGDGTTRLISRTAYDYSSGLTNSLMFGPALIEPIGHTMDVKMLLGIKARAEARAGRSVERD